MMSFEHAPPSLVRAKSKYDGNEIPTGAALPGPALLTMTKKQSVVLNSTTSKDKETHDPLSSANSTSKPKININVQDSFLKPPSR